MDGCNVNTDYVKFSIFPDQLQKLSIFVKLL